jgi:hypothetical protein
MADALDEQIEAQIISGKPTSFDGNIAYITVSCFRKSYWQTPQTLNPKIQYLLMKTVN